MGVLQTPALPLGYVALTRRQALRPAVSPERATGFEPVAFSLARRRSTTEPRPRLLDHTDRSHARTQTRTGDTFIFSEVLYQLSYPGQWDLPFLLMIGPFYRNGWGLSRNSESRSSCSAKLTISLQVVTIGNGSGCVPVDALVFKTSGRLRIVGGGGFDSHPLPPSSHIYRTWIR